MLSATAASLVDDRRLDLDNVVASSPHRFHVNAR